MYVKVKVETLSDKKLIKIPLSLLLDSKYVYGVKNERLVALSVVPEHYFGSEVFISGLENDTFLLKKPLPQAVPNMKVSVVKEEEAL